MISLRDVRHGALVVCIALVVAACGASPVAPTGSVLVETPKPTPDLLAQYNSCLVDRMPASSGLLGVIDATQLGEPNTGIRFQHCGKLYPAVARSARDVQFVFWQECIGEIGFDANGIARKACDTAYPH